MSKKESIRISFYVMVIGFMVIAHYAYEHVYGAICCRAHRQKEAPATFGKSHFIIGMSAEETANMAQQSAQAPAGTSTCEAYFSPDDHVSGKLIGLIDQEKESLKVAIFSFTDGDVARAMTRALGRGVVIEIVADPSALQDRFNKIILLHHAGVPVHIYDTSRGKTSLSNRMHNKFIIFGNSGSGRTRVWTGSYNFTRSADIANQENAVLIDDAQTVKKFIDQYEKLKKRSITLDNAQQKLLENSQKVH